MARDAVCRFSISMPEGLVRQLDEMVEVKGFANRSQAVADMVRNRLVEHRAHDTNDEIAGTVTLVYDHHKRNLQKILTQVQHDHHELIIATLHVHLDHENCLEVLALRGPAHDVRNLSEKLIAAKGVKHGTLTVTTTGKELPR
ncbi:MAG: nickel-responsive transcriptional regulator NikR [Myxococcota bacterium]